MIDNEELKIRSNAIDFLSYSLTKGYLVLFLGAGASYAFGLPGWLDLVNKLRKDVKLRAISKAASPEALQNAAEEVKDKVSVEELIGMIERHLYTNNHKYKKTDIFKNDLLIAFTALFNGNKKGRITRVVTLNYDNMLEWFLTLFGFTVRSISDLPALEGAEDVRIYHPHGFIPQPNSGLQSSGFVILGIHSVNQRIGNSNEPWMALIRHILNSGVCLFVGLSTNTLKDRALEPLFTQCGAYHMGVRPLGIWLLMERMNKLKANDFQRNNIVPLSFNNPKKISQFILEICETAGEKINSEELDNSNLSP